MKVSPRNKDILRQVKDSKIFNTAMSAVGVFTIMEICPLNITIEGISQLMLEQYDMMNLTELKNFIHNAIEIITEGLSKPIIKMVNLVFKNFDQTIDLLKLCRVDDNVLQVVYEKFSTFIYIMIDSLKKDDFDEIISNAALNYTMECNCIIGRHT
jgi:hypothetical protein